MTPKQARHQMRACIAKARRSLDQLEYRVNSDEAFIGSQARVFAHDISGWMYHLISHSAHADRVDEAATPEELEHYETHCAHCGREADRDVLDSHRGACSDACEHALWALEVYGELPTKEA